MSYTKRQLIEQAFTVLGMPSYIFDMQPEQEESALFRLDMMIAEWDRRGVRLGYPLPTSPSDSDISDSSNVPDFAVKGIVYNLALDIAADYGKTVPPTVMSAAYQAKQSLFTSAALPLSQVWPSTMPMGAGNKPWRSYGYQFAGPQTTPDLQSPDSNISISVENGK